MRRVPVVCPENPARRFMVLRVDEVVPPIEIEVACRDCRAQMTPRPRLVLHRYDGFGVLVETEVVPA